tara:strand:+ start:350 stop:616 length:267 start_codon:yes stop_codon:yes gene_type:complete
MLRKKYKDPLCHLKELLEKKGESQELAAKKLSVCREHFNSVLNGKTPVSHKLAFGIEEKYGIKATELIKHRQRIAASTSSLNSENGPH